MPHKSVVKEKAISLRKQGLSYSEISQSIHVPRSTLSYWLVGIKLSKKQKQRLDGKMELNRRLGSKTLKSIRLEKTKRIVRKANSEIKNLRTKDLMLIGTTLYWAEGSKQKEHDPSKEVVFSNSDPLMVRVFLKWLRDCLNISNEDIVFEIYIHETYKRTIKELFKYWSKVTSFPLHKFTKVYFKRNKVHTFRRNRGENYHGVLRITVKRSTDLNRKITGWTEGICREFIS